MILADTSIWADHFRNPLGEIESLVASIMLVQHPFVTGELSLGNFKDRRSALTFLGDLPAAKVATEDDFLSFVANERLHGTGIGFVDAHLLAACRLSGAALWTRDKRLHAQAKRLGCAWSHG